MGSPLTFTQFARELNSVISTKDRLLVAVSGGMDSVALLHLTYQLQSAHDVYAVHVNHGLRDPSDSEELFVHSLCESMDIPLAIHGAEDNRRQGESMEMWGRRIRHTAFESAQKEFNCNWILTGHHANDNVETILMHLEDGCGIEGLRGIPVQNGKILRPLLPFSRKDIFDYVQVNGLFYVEDESNRDTSIRRNHIRHNIVTPWESQVPTLISRFNQLADKATRAVQRMNEVIGSLPEKEKSGKSQLIIDDDVIKIFSGNQKVRLFKKLIGETETAWRRHHWTSLERWITTAKTGSIFQVNGKWFILRDRNQWLLKKKTLGHDGYRLTINHVSKFTKPSERTKEIIDGSSIKDKNIQLRKWKAGDQFQPLGMDGTKKVSDLLIDEKVDRFTKENQLVVTADGKIIWVCGKRISETAKVTEKTIEFMELSLERELG